MRKINKQIGKKEWLIICLYILMAIIEITKIILKVIKLIDKERVVIVDE